VAAASHVAPNPPVAEVVAVAAGSHAFTEVVYAVEPYPPVAAVVAVAAGSQESTETV